MKSDQFIEPTQWLRIERELDAIERERNVRILLAVESGSRAWRFPSLDSDYDVRFIYAHPSVAYLSIEAPTDVIERPIDGALDIGGWDIRKALQLLVRSNAVLVEWLTSPVRYRASETIPDELLALVRDTYHLPAVAYHYDRMARRLFGEIMASSEVRLKAYCYALRCSLALRWVRDSGTIPPMDLPRLRSELHLDVATNMAVDRLLAANAASDERRTSPRLPRIDAFIAETLQKPVDRFVLPDRTHAVARANNFFLSIMG